MSSSLAFSAIQVPVRRRINDDRFQLPSQQPTFLVLVGYHHENRVLEYRFADCHGAGQGMQNTDLDGVFACAQPAEPASASGKTSNPNTIASRAGSEAGFMSMPLASSKMRVSFVMPLATTNSRALNWKQMPSPQIDIFAHKDRGPKLLVQAFEARCQVDRVAKSRVVHALRRPKVADDGLPDMNAEPREERLQTLSLKLGVELFTRQLCPRGLPGRPARRGQADGLGAFQNTITASPMNLSTVPPSARNASVSTEK